MSTSSLLRESTREQHSRAESQSFIQDLMKGKLSSEEYVSYATQLAWLYAALENQTSQGVPFPSSEDLWDESLQRSEALARDLEQLGVADWRHTTSASPAMQNYIDYLGTFEGRADIRLIAHHYTRYLGDLSGGQAIASLVKKHYGLTENQLSFYSFPKIDNIVRYKENYRKLLDGLQLSEQDRKVLIQEAQHAFDLNTQIFQDLNAAVAGI